ncbi:PAS domain S-box protein [Marinomonas communis]|uniref:PAS domain S-box protein n=1 Tax=Marinomonas communis TaxID=28254 RepID=UPI001D184FBB|nr:PAS domain S-box protein [Marinomonas communis]MCC4274661.1 PAS domain S-box protein [Marinomonas communis]
MNSSSIPLFPHPINWTLSFSGAFAEFRSLAVLLERTGAVSHWAVVLEGGDGLYVEEGIIKPMSALSVRSLEWFTVSNKASLGVPLYVDSHIIHDALPLINSLLGTGQPLLQPESSYSLIGLTTSIADDLPFLVSAVDTELRYQYANKFYEKVFKHPRESLIGQSIKDIIGDEQFNIVEPYIQRALQGEHVEVQIPAVLPNRSGSSTHHHIACSFTPNYKAEEIQGVYICVRDQTPLKRITQALKQFHEITTDTASSLESKIQDMLDLGVEILNLPVGIVSHVVDQNYEVMYGCGGPEQGATFNLGECYCVHTLNRDQVTGFYHASQSDIATHPCYENFKLESYLGVSLKVNGKVWGTLNFSSLEAKDEDFSDDEYELVKLFGQWLQSELSKAQEQKEAIDAERQHRLIVESVHDGIVGVDNDCKITFANPAAAKLIGVDSETIIGQSITYLLRDRSRSTPVLTHYENLITHAVRKRHKINSKHAVFYSFDGREIPVKFSCTPVEGGEQDGLAGVITFHDISEQKIAENALNQQMELFRSLFMDAPEAIVVTDKDRRIVMANPHTLDLFNYKESDLIGKTPDFLYAHSSDFNEVGQAYTDQNTPELVDYKMRYRRADGSEFIAENVRSKILDEDGKLKGYIIHARDITSRLKIENEVSKAQSRLSIAADSAKIGVWEMDIQRASLIWDQRMFDLYGLSSDSSTISYSVWEEMLHPDDLERVRHESDRVIETHQDLDIVFRIIRADGEIRYIKANARTAMDREGHPLYLFGTNIDVTERYETEAILKEAREEAIRASQAKSNFLATMSHEIRTPLNGVLGMAEVLSSSELTKQQHNQLGIIRSSGESLLELINEILDFSKIEAGHFSLELIDFDLEAMVYDLSRLLVIKAEAKGIDLLVEYNLKGVSIVRGDAYRIRQVLTNLVGNAIKFTEKGQVIIQVDSLEGPKGHEINVQISVIDTGIGITADAQSNLFKAFVQADNSTTRKFGGTGLGLAITKQLVELMGGEINVKSKLGEGSVFTISLPLQISEFPSSSPSETLALERFEKILVVDDNPTNLSILENQLKQCEMTAEFMQQPLQAFEKLIKAAERSEPYDLLILDYLMPDMDGLKLAEMLQELVPSNQLPHIMMISSAGTLASEDLKRANIDVCLNKPASIRDLKAGFESMLHKPHEKSRVIDQSYSVSDLTDDSYKDIKLPAATILVVEDMRANLAVVKGMLASYELTIETADNGVEAIEKWQQCRPDLILMDLHMPIMDGLTAIEEIRKNEESVGGRVPILALTADIQPERIEQVNAIGGDGYITKPFKGSELIRTISTWLNKDEVEASDDSLSAVPDAPLSTDSLDPSVLQGLEELLGEQVQEVVLAFLQDAEGIMSDLNNAGQQGYPSDMIYRPAHSLKSVSANVGAVKLSEMALTLEKQAKSDTLIDAEIQISAITKELESVKAALKQNGRLP